MIGTELFVGGKQYVIETHLGQGGYGHVYKAAHIASGDRIAVKVLPGHADDIAKFALQNEIELAGNVNHPNVVKILDVNLDPEHKLGPYIAMEYAGEGTLKRKLVDLRRALKFIPLDEVTQIMLAIAQGARAINEFLVHRDIKPDNILFDGSTYKISDFGIAKIAAEATRDLTFKGIQHPAYMAPENWLSEKNSEKLDVYSTGLVFYEILWLRHPMESFVSNPDSRHAWESVHKTRACPDVRQTRPDVSESWSRLLLAMTAKKPQSRPDWDEVIRTIDGSDQIKPKAFKLVTLLDAATKACVTSDTREAAKAEEDRLAEEKRECIALAINDVTAQLDEVIEEFNSQLPFEKFEIVIGKDQSALRTYKRPGFPSYIWNVFPAFKRLVRVPESDKIILAAGYLGPALSADQMADTFSVLKIPHSCNLLLIESDDPYGDWMAASLKDSWSVNQKERAPADTAMCNGDALLLQLDTQRQQPRLPGLTFRADVQQAFADLLEGAIRQGESIHQL